MINTELSDLLECEQIIENCVEKVTYIQEYGEGHEEKSVICFLLLYLIIFINFCLLFFFPVKIEKRDGKSSFSVFWETENGTIPRKTDSRQV